MLRFFLPKHACCCLYRQLQLCVSQIMIGRHSPENHGWEREMQKCVKEPVWQKPVLFPQPDIQESILGSLSGDCSCYQNNYTHRQVGLLCHLCKTKHTTLGHTLAILWLTQPCKTFAAIIGLRHKGQSPSSLPLTFHKLSSCQLEAVSWQHCLKLFKSMMFKLEMTENFLW